jgi:uncharacterized Zn finger protein
MADLEARLSEMHMRPYVEEAACPACGFGSVATTFVSRFEFSDQKEFRGTSTGDPFLARRCERCGCSWPERAVEEEKPSVDGGS